MNCWIKILVWFIFARSVPCRQDIVGLLRNTIRFHSLLNRFAGVSMQAGIIHTRHDLNQMFYKREVENTDILYGKVCPLFFVHSFAEMAQTCVGPFKCTVIWSALSYLKKKTDPPTRSRTETLQRASRHFILSLEFWTVRCFSLCVIYIRNSQMGRLGVVAWVSGGKGGDLVG